MYPERPRIRSKQRLRGSSQSTIMELGPRSHVWHDFRDRIQKWHSDWILWEMTILYPKSTADMVWEPSFAEWWRLWSRWPRKFDPAPAPLTSECSEQPKENPICVPKLSTEHASILTVNHVLKLSGSLKVMSSQFSESLWQSPGHELSITKPQCMGLSYCQFNFKVCLKYVIYRTCVGNMWTPNC